MIDFEESVVASSASARALRRRSHYRRVRLRQGFAHLTRGRVASSGRPAERAAYRWCRKCGAKCHRSRGQLRLRRCCRKRGAVSARRLQNSCGRRTSKHISSWTLRARRHAKCGSFLSTIRPTCYELIGRALQPSTEKVEDAVLERALAVLPRAGALLLSDYAKGVLTPRVVRTLIDAARAAGFAGRCRSQGPQL